MVRMREGNHHEDVHVKCLFCTEINVGWMILSYDINYTTSTSIQATTTIASPLLKKIKQKTVCIN